MRLTPLWLALLAACSGGAEEKRARPAPVVEAAAPTHHMFRDRIDAIGTARANEQVTLASNVSERVERILFDDGMFVRRGQLLAVLTQGQERASLQGAIASETQAKAQYDRISQLNERGFATRALLDEQTAAVAKARSDAASLRAEIGDRMIRAPFAGYVSLRNISAGTIVASGTPIVTISDLSRIKLDFTVPETSLSKLRIGQPITATAAAFPDTPFTGTISVIDPVIDLQSRAVSVRAILPNPGARIKPGMLLNVQIEISRRNALAVPEIAVLSEGDTRYVYVLDKDKKAKRTDVQTGLREDGLIEVTGLPVSAQVITEGVVKVTDGMTVKLAGADDGKPGKPAGGTK